MEYTEVILVDVSDRQTGVMEKMEAHRKGLLHRAFSVFIFNAKGEMLLQQRALSKYHSGGLWTNACCSHPFPGEATEDGAKRRLREELGFETEIKKVFDFVYKAEFDNGLTEHEFDHVFAGYYDGNLSLNIEEVMDCRFLGLDDIAIDMKEYPEQYTAWFHLAMPKISAWLENH